MKRPGRPGQGQYVQVRTTQAREKSLAQLAELRASGQLAKAMVIAELRDGSIQVLGQEMRPDEMAPMLAAAAHGLAQVMEGRAAPKLEPRQAPQEAAPTVGLSVPMAQRGIRTGDDGLLHAPPGEVMISCGECGHPRWHVTVRPPDDAPGRYACAACGNEIIWHEIHHAEGRA